MWCYDHAGNLLAVPQQGGVKGKGGMPADFRLEEHGLRKLKVARYKGLLFGTFADEIMSLEDYLGPQHLKQIDRILSRPIRVLSYYRQMVEANWKLYAENTRDPYHAPLLHLFHVSFGIQTPAMKGGSFLDPEKKHNCILSIADPDDAKDHELLIEEYKTNTKYRPEYGLKDPRLIGTKRSHDDNINLVIMSIFPSLVIAQVEQAFQIRHIRPKGPEKFEIFWTYFGFDDGTDEETADKLRLANMIGPAGFISMEDGEATRLVQQSIRTQTGGHSFIEMGGRGPRRRPGHPRPGGRAPRLLAVLPEGHGVRGRMSAADTQAILDLFADYALCLDERRFADWPDFFTQDCHYEVQTRENRDLGLPGSLILCESHGMVQDRVRVLEDTLTYPFLHIRHLITNIRIHGELDGAYEVSASYLVLHTTEEGETRIFSTGKYEDEVVIADGGVKFRRKVVIADTAAIDNLLAVPL